MSVGRRLSGVVVATVLALALAGAFAADPPAREALGVPDEVSINKAARVVRTTYRAQYAAATTPVQRIELASKLFKEALLTKDDPPGKYVLLCEARDLAARAGDAPIARRAVLELARSFGAPPAEMMIQSLAAAAQAASTPGGLEAAARSAVLAAEDELARDDDGSASKLMAIAQSAAAKSRRSGVAAEVQDRAGELTWCVQQREEAGAALEALTLAQADPRAKFLAGRFKCLVKGEFDRGLALAAEGSDPQWQELARTDQAAAGDAAAQARAADQWWEYAANQPARARYHCRLRAAMWYRRALPGLAGLTRTTAEQRIEDLEQAQLRRVGLSPGLATEIFAGEKFEQSLARRIDPQLDFEWSGAPGEGLPKDHFSMRWTGKIRAPAAGLYTFILHANEGARVWIDDTLAVDLPEGTRKRSGKKETIRLAEGLHELRVEFWESTGIARIRLSWSTPVHPAEEPVPPRFFAHEAGTEK